MIHLLLTGKLVTAGSATGVFAVVPLAAVTHFDDLVEVVAPGAG